MTKTYSVYCDCKTVGLTLIGKPIVHAYCHCNDCRELLDIPYHSVTAWKEENASIEKGEDQLAFFQHPTKQMKKYFCKNCGETLFNTNSMGWRVVTQLMIAKNNGNVLPNELSSNKHFFYEQRVIDIDDDLPKYLRGTDGPMYHK